MAKTVPPPAVRRASTEDRELLKSFRSGFEPWYRETVQRMIRRLPTYLDGGADEEYGLVVLLFKAGDQLTAVSAYQRHSAQTADFVVMALATEFQGARIEDPDGRPLVVAVLEDTLRDMAANGYERVVAQAARENVKAVRLLRDFTRTGSLDADYDLYAANLTPL